MGVRIVTDSASAISVEDRARYGIEVVPLHLSIDGAPVPEEELRSQDFFDLVDKAADFPQTSQPSPEEFATVFERLTAHGDDVLALLISAGMSGTVESARQAAERSRPGGGTVEVFDTRSNSLQEGFAVLAAAEAASAGASLKECVRAAAETVRRTRFLFAPKSLEYLQRGGRISGAAALVSVALKIAPVLTAEKGTTAIAGVARGQNGAWAKIKSILARDAERHGLKRAVVQYIADREPAERMARELVSPILGHAAQVVPIHPTVGVHVGPAVGIAYETERPLR